MHKSKKMKEVPDKYAMFGHNTKKPKATSGYGMLGQDVKKIAKASKTSKHKWY